MLHQDEFPTLCNEIVCIGNGRCTMTTTDLAALIDTTRSETSAFLQFSADKLSNSAGAIYFCPSILQTVLNRWYLFDAPGCLRVTGIYEDRKIPIEKKFELHFSI